VPVEQRSKNGLTRPSYSQECDFASSAGYESHWSWLAASVDKPAVENGAVQRTDEASAFWRTSISRVEPNEIRIRGYPIEQLIDQLTLGELLYLMFRGTRPSYAEGQLIEAILVSCCDHSLVAPSVDATRFVASGGVPLSAAVAAGLLSIGKHHGGAIEDCAAMLVDLMATGLECMPKVAEDYVRAKRERQERIPGYGHPIHHRDPRVKALIEKATYLGLRGPYVELALAVECALAKFEGRLAPLNVDGIIAALMLQMGFEPVVGSAFFIVSRTVGLAAHAYEEMVREKPFREVDYREVYYDGPAPRSL
jgi:citryl-CoA lyase